MEEKKEGKNPWVARIFVLLAFCTCFVIYGVVQVSQLHDPMPLYTLHPTFNTWNFLKLNTKTGQLYQVQFAVNSDKEKEPTPRFQIPVNDVPLVNPSQSENGRFVLKKTENYWNVLVMDTVTGQIWQMQWTIEDDVHRGIVDEIKLVKPAKPKEEQNKTPQEKK